MSRIKCVIVDDEITAARIIEKFVLNIPELELVATFTDAEQAYRYLKTSDVYLVFLDISMDGMSGFEMASIIKTKVIFTTGSDRFAVLSWQLENVVGYLLKPIFFEDIVKMVKRVSVLFTAENTSLPGEDFLAFKRDNLIVRIALEDIVYLRAGGNYTTIYLHTGEEIAPIPIWELKKSLPQSKFIRVNKSDIANRAKIIRDEKEIILVGGERLRISKSYYEKTLYTD